VTVLSDAQIAATARLAGFTGQDVVTAVAVALAESSGRTDATNHNSDGSTDYGLWQINSVHADLLKSGNWQTPLDNAKMAKSVHDNAGSWQPWSTFNSGAWLAYYGRAKVASTATTDAVTTAGQPNVTLTGFDWKTILEGPGALIPGFSGALGGGAAGALTGGGISGLADAITSLGKFLAFVADPKNWLRVAEFLGGLAIVAWGLWQFVNATSLGGAIKSTAKSAAEGVAVAVAA